MKNIEVDKIINPIPASDGAGAAAAIIQDYNEGVGFANYTAHCSPAGWADPSFTVRTIEGARHEQYQEIEKYRVPYFNYLRDLVKSLIF